MKILGNHIFKCYLILFHYSQRVYIDFFISTLDLRLTTKYFLILLSIPLMRGLSILAKIER